MVKSASKRHQFIVIRVMELGKLSHAIAIDVLTIGNAVIRVFVTLALILRLLIVFLFIITALVQQWRI